MTEISGCIKYACICNLDNHDEIIMYSECNLTPLDFRETISSILNKINRNCKSTYLTADLAFNYLFKDEVLYVAVCETIFPKRIAFAYLEKVSAEFLSDPHKKYTTRLQVLMDYYNHDLAADQTRELNSKITNTTAVMGNVITDLVERGTKIEDTLDSAESVETTSENLGEISSERRVETAKKNIYMSLLMLVVIVIICVILSVVILFFVIIVIIFMKFEYI